uniref:N(6)-adenosine-methyltransferase non-catalytic subunit METTL14 n=1 Tax=Piliocolobus tephrosceles TaxID=591936 RepID=A0A8C9GIT9_9PRIM
MGHPNIINNNSSNTSNNSSNTNMYINMSNNKYNIKNSAPVPLCPPPNSNMVNFTGNSNTISGMNNINLKKANGVMNYAPPYYPGERDKIMYDTQNTTNYPENFMKDMKMTDQFYDNNMGYFSPHLKPNSIPYYNNNSMNIHKNDDIINVNYKNMNNDMNQSIYNSGGTNISSINNMSNSNTISNNINISKCDNNSRNSSNNNQKLSEKKTTPCNINVDGRERLQNDYNQNFVNTGERPQNFIRDSDENKRFVKYPKLKQLLELKNIIIKKRSTPARYIKCDLRTFDLGSLDMKFDVILIDPPWKEYYDRKIYNLDILNNVHINNYDLNSNNNTNKEKNDKYWSLEDIANLEIEKIAAIPSFLFLWCGVTHLEDARVLLNKWGYRRCEDICWLKTNINEKNKRIKYLNEINNENSYLQRTTEHCLVGIKGAVRRSSDIHLIHANLDTDVIIAEETDENINNNNKPEELYKIIEKFCLGRRKIELFGTNRNIRNGWLTLGINIDTTLFNKEEYTSWFEGDIAWPEATSYIGGKYMGTTTEIENLRPKSPPRNTNTG